MGCCGCYMLGRETAFVLNEPTAEDREDFKRFKKSLDSKSLKTSKKRPKSSTKSISLTTQQARAAVEPDYPNISISEFPLYREYVARGFIRL